MIFRMGHQFDARPRAQMCLATAPLLPFTVIRPLCDFNIRPIDNYHYFPLTVLEQDRYSLIFGRPGLGRFAGVAVRNINYRKLVIHFRIYFRAGTLNTYLAQSINLFGYGPAKSLVKIRRDYFQTSFQFFNQQVSRSTNKCVNLRH